MSDTKKPDAAIRSAEERAVPMQRSSAHKQHESAAILNQRVPQPVYDQNRRLVYITAPTAIPQFACPLPLTGTPYLVGDKRTVSSGWGDPRQTVVLDGGVTPRKHSGLDFIAPTGEAVFASDAGFPTVKIQIRGQARVRIRNDIIRGPLIIGAENGVGITNPWADRNTGDIHAEVDGVSQIIVPCRCIGHGGLYVSIYHHSPHQNYVTQYMHLSAISATAMRAAISKKQVALGEEIGKVGRTGGDTGRFNSSHLHWQCLFNGIPVKPEPLVPHHHVRGGSEDSNPMRLLSSSGPLPAGQQIVNGQAAGKIASTMRTQTLEDTSHTQHREGQAQHLADGARRDLTATAAIYEAVAKYQHRLPEVEGGMVFNFDTGLWSSPGKDKDGKDIPGSPL